MEPQAPKNTLQHIATSSVIVAANLLTSLTKAFHFTPNKLSIIMDTAGGGTLKHGGFHRLYGGHDVFNFSYWNRYGTKYAKELGKDFLTPNGLPYPKLQYAVKKGYIKAATAQKYGTWTVGKACSAAIGIVDSAFVINKFLNKRHALNEHWVTQSLKGCLKLGIGAGHGNIPLAAAGATDLSLIAFARLEAQVCLGLYNSPDSFFYENPLQLT